MLALNGLTIMLAEALRADHIAVNSMCPGWVRTDMGGPNATLPVEEGADTAVWLADEAPVLFIFDAEACFRGAMCPGWVRRGPAP
jgi:NAD(P)-dependent dehydrogenase (short-subunit alcohol dehydrogenase family)